MDPTEAATELHRWVVDQGISVLNVAGSRASKDPAIYTETYHSIRGLKILDAMEVEPGTRVTELKMADVALRLSIWPRTMEEALVRLDRHLPQQDRLALVNAEDDDLGELHEGLSLWVQDNFGLWHGNYELAKNVGADFGNPLAGPEEVAAVIVSKLVDRINLMAAIGRASLS